LEKISERKKKVNSWHKAVSLSLLDNSPPGFGRRMITGWKFFFFFFFSFSALNPRINQHHNFLICP